MQNNPLIDVAMATISDSLANVSPADQTKLRSILQSYISNQISYNNAVTETVSIIGSSQPIDKIEEIIRTPETPIPYNPTAAATGRTPDRLKARSWNAYEDRRLLSGIHKYGLDNWPMVAAWVGNGRTKSQCSQRWLRGLDPKIEKNQWTEEQDEKLLMLVSIFSDKCWTKIANVIGNRCDVQCRYRYRQLQKDEQFQNRMEEARLKAQSNPQLLPSISVVDPSKIPEVRVSPKKKSQKSPQRTQPTTPPQSSYCTPAVTLNYQTQLVNSYQIQGGGVYIPAQAMIAQPAVMPGQMIQPFTRTMQMLVQMPSAGTYQAQRKSEAPEEKKENEAVHFDDNPQISPSTSFTQWSSQNIQQSPTPSHFGIAANDSFLLG